MNEIPQWWIVVSGVFFAVNLLFFAVLTVFAIKIFTTYNKLEPKIHSLTERVDSIAGKVDAIATQAKETVTAVGDKTKNLASSVDTMGGSLAGQIGKFMPLLTAVLTLFKVFTTVRDFNADLQERKSLPKKGKRRG